MSKSNSPYRKPEDAWRVTENGVELTYPIFHHDPTSTDDPIIKKSIEEVIGDLDFYGWKGGDEDRIIDSNGNVFIAKFEETKGKALFIISTTQQSGVFPGEVERKMDISEIKEIMHAGIERNAISIKTDIDELHKTIDSMNSIKDILMKCGEYF